MYKLDKWGKKWENKIGEKKRGHLDEEKDGDDEDLQMLNNVP
jgi:hypothetical protein